MRIIYLLFLSVILFSCNYFDGEKTLPGITGKSGELLIIADDNYWQATTGDLLLDVFAEEVVGLPQPEPMFDPVNIRPTAFADIFRTHRNIFMLNVDPNAPEALEIKKDVWATPQMVISLTVSDTARAREVMETKGENIVKRFLDMERDRNVQTYTSQKDKVLADKVKDITGVDMAFPLSFKIARQEADFMWIRQETGDMDMAILVSTFKYEDKNTFTKEFLMDKRDEITKMFIPGESKGTFMKIYRDYPVQFKETDLNGVYAIKINGLWNVEGDFMGGPFITYAMLNETQNQVVLIDAFVFAPKLDKRNYMRQLDAIISTARF